MIVNVLISLVTVCFPKDSGYVFKYVSNQDTIVVRSIDIENVDTLYNSWKYKVSTDIVAEFKTIKNKDGDLFMYSNKRWHLVTKQSIYCQTLPDGYYYIVNTDSLILRDGCIHIRFHQLSRKEKLMKKKLKSAFEAYQRRCSRIIKHYSSVDYYYN